MALTKGFVRNAQTSPLDARLMDMGQVVCSQGGAPRTGVLGGNSMSLVTPTASMNVAVAPAEFVQSKGKADGVVIFTNDGTVNVPIPAAPAANSRIDVVYVKHNDDTTGDANATPIFGVLQGAAAASPTKPGPIPTGAIELATVRVYAGTTATNGGSNTVTNTYQMTAMRGGCVIFRTKAEMLAWTDPTNGQEALVLWDANVPDRGGYVYVNGYGWAPHFAVYTEFQRPNAADATFTGANTNVVQGTIVNAPPGLYRIDAYLGLYSSGGATGFAFVSAAGVERRRLRHDLIGQPINRHVMAMYEHPGGDLVIGAGYSVSSGSATVTSSPTGGLTLVGATFLGR